MFGDNFYIPDMVRKVFHYEEKIKRVLKSLLLEEYYEEGVRNMSCAHVMKELETKNYYSCTFPVKDFRKTRAGRKHLKFL